MFHLALLINDTVAMNVDGAGPGNVSDHVIIERQSESAVTFCEGAKDAYLGYVTLRVGGFYLSD